MSVECILGEIDIQDHFNIATHNGVITCENTHRGTHRTFKISTQKPDATFAPNSRILSLLVGPDNESSYQRIGFVKNDGSVALWKRFQTPQYQALVDVLINRERFEKIGVKYHFAGTCRVCNRQLTTPESIKAGIGPVCANRQN